MFQTDGAWEINEGTEHLRKLFGQPGLRRYQCIEVPMNHCIFHVDLKMTPNDGDVLWHRYMLAELVESISLIDSVEAVESRITVQGMAESGKPYEFYAVIEVIECELVSGKGAFICILDTGVRMNMGSFNDVEIVESTLKTVWMAGRKDVQTEGCRTT